LFTRFALTAMILLASVLLHLGLLGVILWAERRGATASETEAMEVELVQPPELPKAEPPKPEPNPTQPKPEPPKIEAAKAEPPKPAEQKPPEPAAQPSQPPEQPPAQSAKALPPDQPPAPPEKPVQPQGPSGGPSESKSKLTPEEIAAFRAQVQKCWTLPVGVPNAMKLEAVLRVSLARNGALAAGPELLKANASAGGPVLVGIAMKALRECAPYRSLPAAKYNDWKVLDLRFLATGMTGLGSARLSRPPG
jgi:outer membrane biosynthesis protein TonB